MQTFRGRAGRVGRVRRAERRRGLVRCRPVSGYRTVCLSTFFRRRGAAGPAGWGCRSKGTPRARSPGGEARICMRACDPPRAAPGMEAPAEASRTGIHAYLREMVLDRQVVQAVRGFAQSPLSAVRMPIPASTVIVGGFSGSAAMLQDFSYSQRERRDGRDVGPRTTPGDASSRPRARRRRRLRATCPRSVMSAFSPAYTVSSVPSSSLLGKYPTPTPGHACITSARSPSAASEDASVPAGRRRMSIAFAMTYRILEVWSSASSYAVSRMSISR